MGAYPYATRDLRDLKEQADDLSKKTATYIRQNQRSAFRRQANAIKNFKEAALYARVYHGPSAAATLTNYVQNIIRLIKTAGTPGVSSVTPAWRHLLRKCEAVGRKMEIFDFADREKLESHLWWMSEQGGAAELTTLLRLKRVLPHRYYDLRGDVDLAIRNINERLLTKMNSACEFFELQVEEIINAQPETFAMGSTLSPEAARKIEILDSLKSTIQEQITDPRTMRWRQNVGPLLRGTVPVSNRTVPAKEVKRLLDEFVSIEEASAGEEITADQDADDAPKVEAYAVACIKDHEPGSSLQVDDVYFLQAGVSSHVPQGFEGHGMSVSATDAVVEFEIVVHAEDMNVPNWRRDFVFKRNEDSSLIEFELTPLEEGDKTIRVDFLYRRHWLTTISFEVNVRKRVQAMSMPA